jgi:hypothetical protein
MRRRFAVLPLRALSVAASLALVAPALAQEKPATGGDPMAGWTPPKVKNEKKDRQEIAAFMKKMEAAAKQADLDASAALVDFPVLMVTDDKEGEASADSWSREQWVKVMEPFYKAPMPTPKHTPTIFLVTDSLAVVTDVWTMPMGGKKVSGRNAMLLVRTDGEWKAKAMMEGGWGDMPMGDATAAEPAKQ